MVINEEFFKAASKEDAELIIAGIPFDSTTSFRPGSRFGPQAMRNVLFGLETYSPYQKKDFTDIKAFDMGDIEVVIGNAAKTLAEIEKTLFPLFSSGKKILSLGGEHLVTLGVIKSLTSLYSDLLVIHLDAHVDMRDDYLGEKLSHASVMRRVAELIGFENIYQFGIRSGPKEEWEISKQYSNIYPFNLKSFSEIVSSFPDEAPIYLTLDLDILDPAYLSGTGTPEPLGVTTKELHKALLSLRGKNIIGADIVELAPDYDNSGTSSVTAAFFMREISLLMA
jgi:agmatinase